MKTFIALILCWLGMAWAQSSTPASPKVEDIRTSVEVKQLVQGKLQEVTLVKKGQLLVYLVKVTARADFPAGKLGLKLVAPEGATLLPERTQIKGYTFRLEYSQDGKNFQKSLKTWKYLRVVILNTVKAGSAFEVRLLSKVN